MGFSFSKLIFSENVKFAKLENNPAVAVRLVSNYSNYHACVNASRLIKNALNNFLWTQLMDRFWFN